MRTIRAWFTDSHYLELIRLACSLKPRALEKMNNLSLNPDDPRTGVTSIRVRMLYTIDEARGIYFHHLSFSAERHFLAFAAGGSFLYVVATSLGILSSLRAVAHSPNGVIYAGFILSAIEQRTFAERTVKEPQIGEIRQAKDDANKWFDGFWKSHALLRSEDEFLERMGDNEAGVAWR